MVVVLVGWKSYALKGDEQDGDGGWGVGDGGWGMVWMV